MVLCDIIYPDSYLSKLNITIMKSVLKISMYFGILAGFALATGIPQFIYKQKDVPHVSPFTQQELSTLKFNYDTKEVYFDTLLKSREKLAQKKQYTPHIYFSDIKQSCLYKEKYRDREPAPNRFNGGRTSVDNRDTELLQVLESQDRGIHFFEDMSKASEYWFPAVKYRSKSSASEDFSTIGRWLLRFYLRGFPVAFILFLIWKFQTRKKFFAPASFLFSLIVWPIVLSIDIYNKFEEALVRADVVSRRGKLLSLFSKQEEQLFELGKKMTRVEFRTYLDSIGMVQKHSFASALLVTLFLIIIPASLFPQTTPTAHKEKVIMVKSDYGGGGMHYDVVAKSSAVLNYGDDVKQFPEFVKLIFYITDWLYEYVFVPDIGKVPLVI